MSRAIDIMPVTAGKTATQTQTDTNTRATSKVTSTTRAIDVMPVTVGKTTPAAETAGASNGTTAVKQTNTQTPAIIQSANERLEAMKSAGAATETEGQSDGLIDAIISVANRVKNTASGAVKSTGAAYANVGGLAAEGAGKANTRIANYTNKEKLDSAQEAVSRYQAMLDSGKWADGTALTAAGRKQVQSMLEANQRTLDAQKSYTDAVEASDKAVADVAYQKADQLSASGAQDIAQAKEGLGKVGQFAVDLGVQGVQMVGDIAASAAVPGSGLALMGVRSAGSAAQEARQSGATYGQQLAYGLGSGALSVATEKLGNVAAPFRKAFGGDILDKVIPKVAAKMTGSAAGKLALSMLSEGGEEFVEDLVQPILQRMTYDKAALGQYGDADYWAQTLYDFLVGAAMGGIGSGVEAIQNRKTARNAAGNAAGAQTAEAEGSFTAQTQNASQTAQTAASGVETAGNKGETVQVVENLRNNIPNLENTEPVSAISAGAVTLVEGRTMAEKARRMFDAIKGVVTRPGFGDVDINGRSVKDDLSHGVGAAKAAVIPAIPEIIRKGQQIDFQQNWKGRAYDGYVFAAPVTMDGETVYVAAVVKQTSKNRFYLHEVVDADGNVIKIDAGESANPTSLAANGDAGTRSTTSTEGTNPLNVDSTIAQGAENVKTGEQNDGLGNADAGTVNTAFDTMQAQSDTFHPVNPNSAQRIQNGQRRAPSEVPTTNPETGDPITKTVSTILNSPLTSPEMAPIYENAIAGGKFDYEAVTDRDSVQRAQEKIRQDGYYSVANTFTARVDLGQTVTKQDMAEAISAYNQAVSEGDHKTAFELTTAIVQAAHTSAQVVQAMNLMNRMTPEGRLLSLRRVVDQMNERQSRSQRERTDRERSRTNPSQEQINAAREDYIEMAQAFRLSDELATNYLMAETDEARAAAWDAITTDLASQISSTFREKADFWRYTSMLTNPTTHIRNIMGNAIQMGARKIKNVVGAGIERAVLRDESQRTKSILTRADSELVQFARTQYETDQSAAMGEHKYSDATMNGIHREIMGKRKMFRGDNVFSKAVQGIGDFNTAWLDREDVWFNRPAYVESFAQALKAKGVTAAEAAAGTRPADVDAARAYAISEAQKATYRNTTALSEALSKMGRYQGDNLVLRGGSFLADAFLPFRKTPANILTTGLDYSPVGLGKALYEGLVGVRRGSCEAADVIDSAATGLTGTGILALGAFLAAEGLLHVRAGDDDKEEAFEKATGGQDYALQIGDKSYSLDWAVPAAMPLFAGAAIMKSVLEGGNTFDAVCDSLLGTSEVVLETSMLSSLNDLISNWSYADSKPLYLIDKAVSSYAGQYIPTAGSKIASAFDDTVRKSYVEKGSGQIASDLGYFLQGAAKKVPGVRNQLQPSVDLWGEEVSNGTAAERAFQSFLSPGYLKTRDTSRVTEEVRRLAEATGDSGVYPTAVEKSFKVNGETKYLTAEEYTQYAKTVGQTRKQIVDSLTQAKGYQNLSDEDKAAAISYAYEYATAKGKAAVSAYVPTSGFVKGAMESVLPTDTYILYKLSADRDGNGSVTSAESARTLQEMSGVTDQERGQEWEKRNSSTAAAKNPFTGALPQAGISVDTSIRILEKYREISNTEGVKPKDKGKQFRVYVEGLGLTPAQKQTVKETYSLYGSYYVDW